jgi:hypothetical protein
MAKAKRSFTASNDQLPIYVCSQCGFRATAGQTEHDKLIDELAQMVLAMLPLASRLVSDEFTEAERGQLRDVATTPAYKFHGVFELSTCLNRLCGETARDFYARKDS